MAKQFTWGQASTTTLRHVTHGVMDQGRKPAIINCGHFTRLQGLSFPCNRINVTIMEDIGVELEKRQKQAPSIVLRLLVSTVLNHCHRRELMQQTSSFETYGGRSSPDLGSPRLRWIKSTYMLRLITVVPYAVAGDIVAVRCLHRDEARRACSKSRHVTSTSTSDSCRWSP